MVAQHRRDAGLERGDTGYSRSARRRTSGVEVARHDGARLQDDVVQEVKHCRAFVVGR